MKMKKRLTDTSGRGRCDFIDASRTEGSIRAAPMANAIKTTLTNPAHLPDHSSKDAHPTKPALSYIALIASVILSSPFKKLNLASIYRAMEEQFPYLKSRGPGWRNSVRHNLSVNDCFVKVSRCEDGRGHYWGVHRAYLRDFQQGNFSLYRKAREGRRERERCDKAVRCLARMETYLGRFYESRSLGWVEPQCPLQDPRWYQKSSSDWTQPWSVNVGWVQSTRLRLVDSYSSATAAGGHGSQPVTSRPLHCWEMTHPVLTGMKESYDGRSMTPTLQGIWFPGCWCLSPVTAKMLKPLPYRINF